MTLLVRLLVPANARGFIAQTTIRSQDVLGTSLSYSSRAPIGSPMALVPVVELYHHHTMQELARQRLTALLDDPCHAQDFLLLQSAAYDLQVHWRSDEAIGMVCQNDETDIRTGSLAGALPSRLQLAHTVSSAELRGCICVQHRPQRAACRQGRHTMVGLDTEDDG